MTDFNTLYLGFKQSSTYSMLRDSTKSHYEYLVGRYLEKITNVQGPVTPAVAQKVCDNFAVDSGVAMAHHIRRAVSAIHNYGVRTGQVSINPFSTVRLPNEKSREVVWDLEDVTVLYQIGTGSFGDDYTLRERSCAAMGWVSYATAQRLSQIAVLKASEVTSTHLMVTQTKRGVKVTVPIDSKVADVVQRHAHLNGPLVFGEWSKPQQISKAFDRIRRKAKLDPAYQLRDMRRTRIVEMYDHGCTDAEVMSWSGHQDPSSLKPYRAIWGRELSPVAQNAYDKLNGVT